MSFIRGKVFLVTGGANGVGAGLTRSLLSEDATHVVFLDVAQQAGEALETQLNNNFGPLRAKFIKCDVGNENELAEAYRQVLDKYRRLDVVVNNAAILSAAGDDYKKMMEVNFFATVNSTHKAIEFMRADQGGSGGTVVNISSLVALSHSPRFPVYSATKAAVIHFSKCIGMSENYSKTQVRVLTVCFGSTDTAILHRHNFENFHKDCAQCLTSRASHRQSVESAVLGLLEVISRGESGSTWIVADDKPAVEISSKIEDAYELISNGVFDKNHLEY